MLDFHKDKIKPDILLFLVFCENWFKTRGFYVNLEIMECKGFIKRLRLKFDLFLTKKIFDLLGMEAFEEIKTY